MKKIIEFWKNYEQILTFTLVIAYLCSFCFYFDMEMRTNGWVTIIWLVQFFGLSTYMGLKFSKDIEK